MTRGIDDIDMPVLPLDRRVLRQDRYTALAFQVIRVHDAFGHRRPFVQRTRLLEQAIDQRCLSMIDMRNDRDIADFLGWEHVGVVPERWRIIAAKRIAVSHFRPVPTVRTLPGRKAHSLRAVPRQHLWN